MRRNYALSVCFLVLLSSISASQAQERGEYGEVIAVRDEKTFVMATQWGEQTFKAAAPCSPVYFGDTVVFLERTDLCITNKFIDLDTGTECEVWCRQDHNERSPVGNQ